MTSEHGGLDFTKAKLLVSSEHSCSQVVRARRHLTLSPKFIGQVGTGIKEILDSELKFYSPVLDGIPIAYNNKFTFARSAGTIMDDCPYIHLDVLVDCVVFQPKIGSLLSGCVNKLGQDHVGCLVHGLFNAAIPRPRNTDYTDWEGSHLSLGDEFTFEVTKLFKQSGLLSIRGAFTANSHIPKGSKRKRKDSGQADVSLLDGFLPSQDEQKDSQDSEKDLNHTPKHKKKKRKHSKSLPLELSEGEKCSTEKDRLSIGSVDSGIGVNILETDLLHQPKKKKKKKEKTQPEDSATLMTTEEASEAQTGESSVVIETDTVASDSPERKHLKKKKKKHKHKKDTVD